MKSIKQGFAVTFENGQKKKKMLQVSTQVFFLCLFFSDEELRHGRRCVLMSVNVSSLQRMTVSKGLHL